MVLCKSCLKQIAAMLVSTPVLFFYYCAGIQNQDVFSFNTAQAARAECFFKVDVFIAYRNFRCLRFT